MWRTSAYRSPCEVLREINDLFQEDTEEHKLIRRLLADAESKAKDMSKHLTVYEPNYYKKWEKNKNANEDFTVRQIGHDTPNPKYKYFNR